VILKIGCVTRLQTALSFEEDIKYVLSQKK